MSGWYQYKNFGSLGENSQHATAQMYNFYETTILILTINLSITLRVFLITMQL